jgi:DNA topoisomerase-1
MKNADMPALKAEAKAMKLAYTGDHMAGYSREKKGDQFIYLDTAGHEIIDTEEQIRIKRLALPPAWTQVWVCAKANGHLQATGIDTAGRKQYKYHSQWSKSRNEHKHNRMAAFAKALPLIREKVEADLRREDFTKDKVVALAISMMDLTYIRVGNSVYTKLYGSYGLTSLRNKHIKISGSKIVLAFRGKKGVEQEISVTHARMAHLMKKLKDIPGQELFQYYDTDGAKKSIDSGCINEYLEACTGQDFTAKDFRTWWGTITAATYLAEHPLQEASPQKHIVETLDFVAAKLGNTRTVCKKYYVHPRLLEFYEEGKLDKYLARLKAPDVRDMSAIHKTQERVMIDFITHECMAA